MNFGGDRTPYLKASLEFTQKDVGDLLSLKSKLVSAENDIVEIKNNVELHGNKIEYQETLMLTSSALTVLNVESLQESINTKLVLSLELLCAD